MITAHVIKGVNELLAERGIHFDSSQPFAKSVAEALSISSDCAEVLLRSLHDGASVPEAAAAAGIDPSIGKNETLLAIARAIGHTLGKLQAARQKV